MAKEYTTEQLIVLVRDIGSFNDVGAAGKDDDDIINALNVVMYDELVPSILKLSEEFFVRTEKTSLVSGQTHYRIPLRAVGNSIRDVYWTDGDSRQFMSQIHREHLPDFRTSGNSDDIAKDFYVEGDYLVLVPGTSGAGSLEIAYMFRPGQLVTSDNYRKVLTVDSTTQVTLTAAVPSAWTTADKFDAHGPHSGAENRAWSVSASTVSGTTIEFTTLIDGTVDGTRAIQVGDYVTLEEEAAIPALPRDVHPILAQAAACRMLESDGDSDMLNIARSTLARQLDNLMHVLGQRVEGRPKRVVNRKSFLRHQRRHWGY